MPQKVAPDQSHYSCLFHVAAVISVDPMFSLFIIHLLFQLFPDRIWFMIAPVPVVLAHARRLSKVWLNPTYCTII